MKYDFNKVSKETLVEYAESALTDHSEGCYKRHNAIQEKLKKEAEVKLRTKAEVDADIVKVIRDYWNQYDYRGADRKLIFDQLDRSKLNQLLSEETEG